jgi:hypothetical protein
MSRKIVVLKAVSPLLADDSPVTATAPIPPRPRMTLGYLPARSEPISFDGTPLEYIPVQVFCNGRTCSGDLNYGDYTLFLGTIDPEGNEHGENFDYQAYFGQLIATRMLDPTSAVAQGTILIEEDYWELQFSDIPPVNTPFEVDQTTFSYTVGVSPPELSASLTRSFQHTVQIATQQSVTYKFQWPAFSVETTVGVYQLMRSFSVQADSNLTAYISQAGSYVGKCDYGETVDSYGHGLCLKLETGAAFAYPTSNYFQAATIPPPPTVNIGRYALSNIGELFTERQ